MHRCIYIFGSHSVDLNFIRKPWYENCLTQNKKPCKKEKYLIECPPLSLYLCKRGWINIVFQEFASKEENYPSNTEYNKKIFFFLIRAQTHNFILSRQVPALLGYIPGENLLTNVLTKFQVMLKCIGCRKTKSFIKSAPHMIVYDFA